MGMLLYDNDDKSCSKSFFIISIIIIIQFHYYQHKDLAITER